MSRDPFVLVRRGIVDDPRFAEVYADPFLLGWWLKLYLSADAAWPASAELPASCPDETVDTQTRAGLLVAHPHGRYRMPDVDLQREHRDRTAGAGGRARARTASRDETGRYRPKAASTAGPAPAPAPLVQRHGPARSSSDGTSDTVQRRPANQTRPDDDSMEGGVRPLERAGSGSRRQTATKSPTLPLAVVDPPSSAVDPEHSRDVGSPVTSTEDEPADYEAIRQQVFGDDLIPVRPIEPGTPEVWLTIDPNRVPASDPEANLSADDRAFLDDWDQMAKDRAAESR